jgi:acyl carrier protein
VSEHLPVARSGLAVADVERFLRSTWHDVLPRYEGKAGEDFFELGGNSLLAVVVVAKLSRFLGVRVSAGELFFHSTVEDLARAVWQEVNGS